MNPLLETYDLGHLVLAIIEVLLLISAYSFLRLSRHLTAIALPFILLSLASAVAVLFYVYILGIQRSERRCQFGG